MKQYGTRSFTLIELLVVVAIITVLIAILLPALASARNTAKRVVCASNLGSIGKGMAFYSDDNRGWLPARSGDTSLFWMKSGNPPMGDGLDVYAGRYRHLFALWPYVQNPLVLLCPLETEPTMTPDNVNYIIGIIKKWPTYPIQWWYGRSYWYLQDSYGVDGTREAESVRRGAVIRKHPATGYVYWYRHDSVQGFPLVIDYFQADLSLGVRGFNHSIVGLNALYGDGHARWCASGKLYDIAKADLQAGAPWSGLLGVQSAWYAIDDMD